MGPASFWNLFPKGSLPCCPFCTRTDRELDESKAVLGAWYCSDCCTTFKLKHGELEPIYEECWDEGPRATPRHLPQAYFNEDALLAPPSGQQNLCRSCQHNQSILVGLLSSFDPPPSSGPFDSLARQYRSDLERRYPLCEICRFAVEQRLNQLAAKLKAKRLAASKLSPAEKIAQLRQLQASGKLSSLTHRRRKRKVAKLAGFLWTGAKLILDIGLVLMHRRPELLDELPRLELFIGKENAVTALILAIFGADLFCESGTGRAFFAALLRLGSLIRPQFIFAGQPNLDLILFVGSVLACMWPSSGQKPSQRKTSEEVVDKPIVKRKADSSHMSDPGLLQGKSFSENVQGDDNLNIFSSISVRQDGKNPLLPENLKRARQLFQPARLDPQRAIASLPSPSTELLRGVPSSTSFRIRPTVLDVEQPSGLESCLQSFSLEDKKEETSFGSFLGLGSKPAGRPAPQSRTEAAFIPAPRPVPPPVNISRKPIPVDVDRNAFGQLLMTAGLIGLRLLLAQRTGLIPVLLAISFCLRGFIWATFGPTGQTVMTAVACIRLAWLAGILTEPMLAQLHEASMAMRLLGLLLDMAILATR